MTHRTLSVRESLLGSSGINRKAVLGDSIPIGTIFRGIRRFFVMDILLIVILMMFPEISLRLPGKMKGG